MQRPADLFIIADQVNGIRVARGNQEALATVLTAGGFSHRISTDDKPAMAMGACR
jgi:hypothetical protein